MTLKILSTMLSIFIILVCGVGLLYLLVCIIGMIIFPPQGKYHNPPPPPPRTGVSINPKKLDYNLPDKKNPGKLK